MVKLNSIYFGNLPLAAHCRFDTQVSAEIAVSPTVVVSALGELPVQFDAFLVEEKALEDWVRKSALTEQIKEADRRMDRALTALRTQTRAQEYSPVSGTAEIARRVYIMMMDYGQVARKPYEDQAGDIESILRQFAPGGPYYIDASTLGLGAQITELQDSLTLFDQLLRQRDEESILKPAKTYLEIRREIEPVYRQMETIINAGAITGASPTDFIAFIHHLNPEIDRLNAEFHRARRDIARAEPEPISPQLYTGRPVTPNPKVLFATPHSGTVQLELGRDYNLTFKHNVEVGNAECTLHGKGAYRGRKTVTFVIVRTL